MSKFSPKQRMLNAYRGAWSDRYPVAPEFWYYYPAKVLGVDMIEFEKVPFWQALQTTFEKYQCEGWGATWAAAHNPHEVSKVAVRRVDATRYLETRLTSYGDKTFTSVRMLDRQEPCSAVEFPVKDEADLVPYARMQLSPDIEFDFADAIQAHQAVGGSYLLELGIGNPFTDFISFMMGFESTVFFLTTADDDLLERLQQQYLEHQYRLIDAAAAQTAFESFFVGCSSACNSLFGPHLWRRFDKPYLHAVAGRIHQHGRLMHHHLHGKCLQTVSDLVDIGVDCVCPFERPPGGDVDGREGLREVRRMLQGKVTVNGNVHTVETLIRGNPRQVRDEVRQIKEVFEGDPRLIIGTGDQVGRETPEENIQAMIDEAKA